MCYLNALLPLSSTLPGPANLRTILPLKKKASYNNISESRGRGGWRGVRCSPLSDTLEEQNTVRQQSSLNVRKWLNPPLMTCLNLLMSKEWLGNTS